MLRSARRILQAYSKGQCMAEQCRFLNQLNVQNEESAAQLMSFGYKTPPSLSDAMDATVEST